VPLDRVWFFGLTVLNRVYNFTLLCPKHGQNMSQTGYGITSPEMLTDHYKVINQHWIIFKSRTLLLSVPFNSNHFPTYQYYNKLACTDRIDHTGVVLHRVGFIEYSCFKQGQDFKTAVAPLYPNMGQVPPSGVWHIIVLSMLSPLIMHRPLQSRYHPQAEQDTCIKGSSSM